MDVGEYLSRIGCAAPAGSPPGLGPPSGLGPPPGLEALRRLHARHLLSVPFEDLTQHSGGLVRLRLPLLYDKIVRRRRGGFCFENNGLFSWLLVQLGFRVTLLSGRVRGAFAYGPPFDHLVLMVVVEGRRWLCDVGFGASGFSAPLSLETGAPQEQGHRVYRLRQRDGEHFLEWQREENRGADGDWSEIYKFTLEPRNLEDFSQMCQYHQSSPCSVFFCKSLCTLHTPGGRLTYVGRRLTTVTFPAGGALETTSRELEEDEIPGVLKEKFGIVLDSPLVPKDEPVAPPPAGS